MGRIKDEDIELKLYSNSSINNSFIRYFGEEVLIESDAVEEAKNEEYWSASNRRRIAYRIMKIRLKAGIKQCELAALLGMKESQLSRYENGYYDYPVRLLFEIAQIFAPNPETSLDYIILGKSQQIIDKDVAEILKGKSFEEKEQAVKLLKVHFGMD